MTSHRLVIAEKPSVAASIAAALGVKEKKDGYIEGGGYLISWCVGHLVELADAAVYGEQYKKWSYESLPILPEEWQYTVAADKGKQFKTLKELMHRADVSEVVNANSLDTQFNICNCMNFRDGRLTAAFKVSPYAFVLKSCFVNLVGSISKGRIIRIIIILSKIPGEPQSYPFAVTVYFKPIILSVRV